MALRIDGKAAFADPAFNASPSVRMTRFIKSDGF
jgi:hypothetical protein